MSVQVNWTPGVLAMAQYVAASGVSILFATNGAPLRMFCLTALVGQICWLNTEVAAVMPAAMSAPTANRRVLVCFAKRIISHSSRVFAPLAVLAMLIRRKGVPSMPARRKGARVEISVTLRLV